MNIPFYSSASIHDEIKEELISDFKEVLKNDKFILAENSRRFEEEFSKYCESKYCVSCASGLDAIYLILRCYNIGFGDEVIVPTNTFIATALAVSATGAKPVFVEPKIETYDMDSNLIQKSITSRTKAIIVVHLYGRPCEMENINKITKKYGLKVIEDAAQAHGARYKGKKVGSLGDAAAFSFFPRKNLGALGDGGALVTNDKLLAEKARTIALYGSKVRCKHTELGVNSRLDELQAAFLRTKLKKLDQWNNERAIIASKYSNDIKNELIIKPLQGNADIKQNFYLYVVRVKQRSQFKEYLSSNGIETQINYPIPLYRQECYKSYNLSPKCFPITEVLCDEILSLPLWPGMSEDQVNYVIDIINNWKG